MEVTVSSVTHSAVITIELPLKDIQIVPGGSEPPRSVYRTVSAGRTTTAAQRNLPRKLRTREPRGCLGTGVFQYPSSSIQSCSCATELHTQMLPGESWSPRTAYTLVSPGKTITSLQIRGPRGTLTELSGYTNQGSARDKILLVSVCIPELTLYQDLHTQIHPGENCSPRSADTQACRRDKPQSETARPDNSRDNQMVRGKGKNISNRNQGYMASSEPSSPTTVNPGYPNTHKKQDSDLKSHLTMMIEEFKKDIKNSLKEIQENMGKHIEDIKEETQKSLKEFQENTTKQAKELNKAIQDLKMEIETIKNSQRETSLEIET
jgi:hypothetical protein